MKFLTIFVLAIVLVASILADQPIEDDTPYEEKGVLRKVAHCPMVQLTGQELTKCLPEFISTDPVKLLYVTIYCLTKTTGAAYKGAKLSLDAWEKRQLAARAAQAAKQ